MRTFHYIRLFYWLFVSKQLPPVKKIEDMGLLAVKIGQMYALRSDFLDADKCRRLGVLYESASQVDQHSFDYLLKQHAPKALQDSLNHVDLEPLAVASIGQVHRGILKSGEVVAIKIIKGDFKISFLKDVRAMRRVLKLCVFLYPKLKKVADPIGTLDTIKHLTLTELDLRNEINGIHTLTSLRDKNKKKAPFLSSLCFPRYYKKFSNSKVFVSEFIEGKSFQSLLDKEQLSYDQLLHLFRIHGFYVFLLGQFHGDLHPGNVFVQGDNIVFLDNSNVESVPASFGKGIVQLLFCLSKANYKDAAEVLHDISLVKITEKEYLEFVRSFVDLYQDFDGKTVSEISLTNQMMKTVKLAIHAGMDFEEGMFSIIKTLMYLDGMVLKCNPNAVLLQDVRRFETDLQ